MFIFFILFIIVQGSLFVYILLSGSTPDMLLMQSVTQLLLFGGTAVVFAWMFYDRPLRHLGMTPAPKTGLKVLAAFFILVLLLPLSDWPLWVRNVALCAVIGVCTAKGAITRKTVWPIVICCVGAAFFPTGMGMEAPVLIELAFLLFAGFMSYAFGKEGPADEEA